MKIRIISDSHFNHPNIIDKFEFRPKDYARQICKKVRNNVKEDDLLIHLGDVIFYKHAELKNYLDSMGPCNKVLIKGNHDRKSNSFYYSKGFNLVCDRMQIDNIVLSHIPVSDLKNGEINVHGHLHSNHRHIYEYASGEKVHKYILYDPMAENFMPVILDKLIKNGLK